MPTVNGAPVTLGSEDDVSPSRAKHTPAVRADIGWDDAPCIRLWTADGTETRYRLTPAETAAMIRRLAGYIGTFLAQEMTR